MVTESIAWAYSAQRSCVSTIKILSLNSCLLQSKELPTIKFIETHESHCLRFMFKYVNKKHLVNKEKTLMIFF